MVDVQIRQSNQEAISELVSRHIVEQLNSS